MADVDAVVVGAGPAGSAAAMTLARAGWNVVLVERGPFPGAKNMYGGVIYGRVLDGLVPEWWEEAPIQRWVTRRATMLLTGEQALSVDFRTEAWNRPPYNGATALRSDFDAWLAGHAEAAGATLLCSTTVTGLLREGSRVVGVRTDRPDGELGARVVIACDGVNSFVAKEAGLYPAADPANFTLGVKEVLALPKDEIDRRFGLTGRAGADLEIVGGTGGVAGGGFLYTNLDSLAVGVVLHLPGLAAQTSRPEEIIAGLKSHPAVAPLVDGGELKEFSAHLIPEGGYDAMPELVGDGLLVAGDAAGLCLAAGIWLEGVNYAIGSGLAAGAVAAGALARGDTSAAALAPYRARLDSSFVLRDHRKLRQVPHFLLSERVQRRYPALACGIAERVFRVDNPAPKPGLRRIVGQELKRAGVKARDLSRDALTVWRSFG
ncbi:MAG: FAD-dependent oxidoreductase [Acidimicrobiales bacterium]